MPSRGWRTFRAAVILAGTLAFSSAFGSLVAATARLVGHHSRASGHLGGCPGRRPIRSLGSSTSTFSRERCAGAGCLHRSTARESADSLRARYPVGREIAVGFDPGDPGHTVLHPQIRWWSLALTLAGACLIGTVSGPGKSRHDSPRNDSPLGSALTLLGAACRPAPEDQAGTVPRDSPVGEIPPQYRFLQHPAVGMEDVDSIWAALPYDSILPPAGSLLRYLSDVRRNALPGRPGPVSRNSLRRTGRRFPG